ncbi:DUF3592 domain-containing protein [Streptomyces hiroshimensis]|uniref:DUF3592 domain-containing protein n=1 Tax=Streptomyces hiroshimensis TaxID=66424 RepID=A0ABQ2YMQ1_9ACTN|nr:DUF3592 domain-containing protein [Streptomyces hiroshimensis]GGX89527.1 hypothetical protein GCM10010324_38930 [Streptomyces hiroshimensis]
MTEIAAAGAISLWVLPAYFLHRLLTIFRVMRYGLKAEAECVEVQISSGRDDTTYHHVFEFDAADGRRIRFSEDVAQGIQRGYRTVVHYDPANPERTATIASRDDIAPILLPAFGLLVGGAVWIAFLPAAFS